VTRPLLTALLALAAALALTACGEREEPTAGAGAGGTPAGERLRLVLDYLPNVDHAGIYAAQGERAFENVGLDVELQTPADPAAPMRLLTSGRADLIVSYEPELLLARDKGAKVQSIGALVQVPLTSIMSLGDNPIRRPEDLRGKRIGTAGIPYQEAYLRSIAEAARVPFDEIRKVDVGFNLTPSMLSGRVDATLGAFWNIEGVELERRDRDPVILRMDRLGVPTYNELVIVAREETVRDEGPRLRRFMQALSRGHQALRRDPAAGIDPLLRANRDLKRSTQEAQVKATLPVFFPEDEERPFGWQEPVDRERYARWMADNDLISDPLIAQRAYTNEFLPGEGI
jgi:putative hydroxymethylpyrimidine transport system substrate-binding protein